MIKDKETKGQMAIRTKHKSWSVGQTDKITDRMIQKINVKPIVVHPIILSLTKNAFATSRPGSTKQPQKRKVVYTRLDNLLALSRLLKLDQFFIV